MDNGDTAKSPFDTYATADQSIHADGVSNPRDVGNSHIQHENSDENENDDVTINTEDDDGDDDVDDDVTINSNTEDDDEDDGGNGVQRIGIDDYDDDDDDDDSQRHQKKRKMKTLLSSYEFAPRMPNPSPSSAPKPSPGGRNPLTDWTEPETFVLLNAWGERFLKQGRKSLRSEQWQEVAEKVNQESKIVRTETQCRNRLDTLKKKYKKDKSKFGDGNKSGSSNWVYFKKMDSLLCAAQPKEQGLLSCAVDSGEYVSTNPKANPNRSNDSPEDESEGLPPKRLKSSNRRTVAKSSSSFNLLADSINRFSEVYEKIEQSSRRQLVELEKMRVEFSRDLEMQKKQIMERAQAEIERIRRGLYEEDGVCGKNH